MSELSKKGIAYLEMLPESELPFAVEMLRKLVIAWDPDFTKLTSAEEKEIEEINEEKKSGNVETYTAEQVANLLGLTERDLE